MQYEKLSKSNAMFNLNHAFNLAEKEFGLVKLLDAGRFSRNLLSNVLKNRSAAVSIQTSGCCGEGG